MKNIAILITKLNGGGAERAAANLSIELSRYYNTKIIVFDGRNQVYPHGGGELIDLKLPPKKGFFRKLINLLKRVKALRKIKKEYKIDCTISLMDGPNLVNVLSKFNDKVIISVRIFMSLARKKDSFFEKLKSKFLFRKSDKIVAVAKAIEKDLVINFGASQEKVITINNYVDGKRLFELSNKDESDDKISFDKDFRYIVTVGRLTKQKGHWYLIRAFKKILDKVPNCKLIIIGEGENKEKLKKLAFELGIKDKVIMTGYIKNPHSLILKCDVFAFPSLFEGFSNALLEALACKMPIVSTDCDSGSREILAPDTPFDRKTDTIELAEYGIITPVFGGEHLNNQDALTKEENLLADALLELLENNAMRNSYANKAHRRVFDYSPEVIINQWKVLIEEITCD